jgi:hypothetical protein
MELETVPIEKPDDVNLILGQSHFIKTVDDVYEALAGSSPRLRFGLAFCESSGPCLVRRAGNDDELVAAQKRFALDDVLCRLDTLRRASVDDTENRWRSRSESCRPPEPASPRSWTFTGKPSRRKTTSERPAPTASAFWTASERTARIRRTACTVSSPRALGLRRATSGIRGAGSRDRP